MNTEYLFIYIILINSLMGLFVYTQNLKNTSSIFYLLLSTISTMWMFSNYMTDTFASIFWLQTSYSLGVWVITIAMLWITAVVEDNLCNRNIKIYVLIACILSICSYIPGYIIESFSEYYNDIFYTGRIGWGLLVHTMYYIVMVIIILQKLLLSIKDINTYEKMQQRRCILVGGLISLIVTGVSSFVLPYFSIFISAQIDSIGFLIFLVFVAIAITKHHLFGIQVITLELAFTGLWSVLLLRILTASNLQQALVALGILVSSIVFGIILIQTVIREILLRDKIEKLTQELKTTYASVGMPHDVQNGSISHKDMQLPPFHPRT